VILLFHIPGFYAAVEQADVPALRGQPVIVGGDARKRGRVTAASAEARALGVAAGMSVADALARCPGAALRPTRLRRYRDVARDVRAVLRGVCERLEEDGLDSTWLEVPAREEPVAFAAELVVRVQSALGIAAVAGIGPTRQVAWLAALDAGPAGIRAVPAERAHEFLAPQPVTRLFGLGPATAERLAAAGIATIGELAKRSAAELEPIVGRPAAALLALASAREPTPLRPSPRARSLAQEATLAEPTQDLRSIGDRLHELAARVEQHLERERRAARTVNLVLRFVDDTQVARTRTLRDPIHTQAELRDAALELLSRTQAGPRRVRRIRLQVTGLSARRATEDPRQLRLF
jgi:DNA polymerase-4